MGIGKLIKNAIRKQRSLEQQIKVAQTMMSNPFATKWERRVGQARLEKLQAEMLVRQTQLMEQNKSKDD